VDVETCALGTIVPLQRGSKIRAMEIWSYESIGGRAILSARTRTMQSYKSITDESKTVVTIEANQSKLIKRSGTLNWIERAKSLDINSSRAVEMSP
jgi:hypothetical protein